MAERYRNNRQPGRRQPLTEVRNRANATPPTQPRRAKAVKLAAIVSAQHLPHNESLEPNGSLAVRDSNPSSPETKRVAQVAAEIDRDSKRNSAISTTSTNASGRRRKTYIGHWQLGKTIGKGGCSRVRVVRHKTRHQYGAVKIVTRSTAESTRAQSLANLIESTKSCQQSTASGYRPIPYGLEREIAVMKLLEHPNIVRLYDVWENRNELYLIMEYVAGGELFHYVDERKGLPEDETIYIFRQIVSALLYCHRLLICHRDLKPENILLDQRDLTVKLIDFGMAALQPKGRLLSTPCGSPHYAAPEVVSSRPYDGTQADVWSCGVILYVMLTGTTPYNYSPDGDIRMLFRDIAKAKYWMPPELSFEAKDLIRRIFVPDPKRRITMDGIWDHPLLHKYDKNFGFDGGSGSKEAAIGPISTLNDFKLERAADIDREILRNMRTLWHSEPEQSLIQKLLSNEINQEKLFYAALVKHREENLENYTGPDDMEHSNSDYHHTQAPEPEEAPPVPPLQAPRSRSQYSIMNDEHLRSSASFVAPQPSVSSYDPYRASKDPLVDAQGEYVNVVVHRPGVSGSRKSVSRGQRHPNSLRVETLKQGNGIKRTSNPSVSSLARVSKSRSSLQYSSASRQSITSSNLPSSPPVITRIKPSEFHRRGVSFSHLRRTSANSTLTSQGSEKAPPTPSIPDAFREDRASRSSNPPQLGSSPISVTERLILSKKEKAIKLETPRIKVRRPENQGQNMRNDIRKHSAELEKACEEAFYRSSVGSSLTAHTTFSEKNGPFDTPPSSVSARGSKTPEKLEPKLLIRPLPELPNDTPNTYLTKTLEETRDKLAAYKSAGDENAAKYEEVMRMLENIMPGTPSAQDSRRTTSAPDPKTPDHLGNLPMISEETDNRNNRERVAGQYRSVTAPLQNKARPVERTIRMVPPSSPADSIAPLNVRKQGGGADGTVGSRTRPTVKPIGERPAQQQPRIDHGGLSTIKEDTVLPETPIPLQKKRSGWFGLSKKGTEMDHRGSGGMVGSPPLAAPQQGRPTPKTLSNECNGQQLSDEPPPSAQSSEFPIRRKRLVGGKKGISKWLGRIGGDKEETSQSQAVDDSTFANTNANTNMSLDSLFSSTSMTQSSDDSPPATGAERSWFARFFHIKPASKILCFSIPRGRARQELVILFNEWQRHGIRDLHFSRQTNIITGRVDKVNALDIKPVAFRIELFVVLEHGRKVGLSIARFVQVKGAASAFKKVIEVVDGVMRGRGWMVEDEEKWRALCEVVDGC